MVEEGQPAYLEEAVAAILYRAGSEARLTGKGPLPMAGEYTGQVMLDGLTEFLRSHGAELLPDADRASGVMQRYQETITKSWDRVFSSIGER